MKRVSGEAYAAGLKAALGVKGNALRTRRMIGFLNSKKNRKLRSRYEAVLECKDFVQRRILLAEYFRQLDRHCSSEEEIDFSLSKYAEKAIKAAHEELKQINLTSDFRNNVKRRRLIDEWTISDKLKEEALTWTAVKDVFAEREAIAEKLHWSFPEDSEFDRFTLDWSDAGAAEMSPLAHGTRAESQSIGEFERPAGR